MKVLLVDDEPLLLRALKRQLKPRGLEVELAEKPSEAYRLVMQAQEMGQPFDLVVTDLDMPETTGFGLVLDLYQDLPACARDKLRVIFMSGRPSPERIEEAARLGGVFIDKSNIFALVDAIVGARPVG